MLHCVYFRHCSSTQITKERGESLSCYTNASYFDTTLSRLALCMLTTITVGEHPLHTKMYPELSR
jgi:hypothetical protein